MAKKPSKAAANLPAAEVTATESTASVIGVRGPKGVALDATVTLLVATNPKRAGSKSFERFALYKDGATVQECLDAGVITPDLVYDAAHGFVSIAGYTPSKMFEAKPKKEKAEKPAKKAKAPKSEAAVEAETELAAATEEEMID